MSQSQSEPIHLLSINGGSSSVRFEISSITFSPSSSSPQTYSISPLYSFHSNFDSKIDNGIEILKQFLSKYSESLNSIKYIIHRVVHGGSKFNHPTIINSQTLIELESLNSLAPLHNPHAIRWIKECNRLFPPNTNTAATTTTATATATTTVSGSAIQIACFDTNFFWNLPSLAQFYAVPMNLIKKYSLRRYGFHGFAHQSMANQFRALRPDLVNGGNLITLQLGSGCSVAAISNGRPIDTSMGFSPLEGLIMSTRSGDVDAALVAYLARQEGLSSEAIENILYNNSGVLGLTGEKDMAKIENSTNELSKFVIKLFCYRIIKYIGSYMAILGGEIDGIIFGGGIGENSPIIREEIINQLSKGIYSSFIQLNKEFNNSMKRGKYGILSNYQHKNNNNNNNKGIEVWVLLVDESQVMMDEAMKLIINKNNNTNNNNTNNKVPIKSSL